MEISKGIFIAKSKPSYQVHRAILTITDMSDRREFIKKTAITGFGVGIAGSASGIYRVRNKGKRIGMVGLDTGHSEAFTKSLNDPLAGDGSLSQRNREHTGMERQDPGNHKKGRKLWG